MRSANWIRLLILVILAAGAAAALLFVPIKPLLIRFLEWSQSLGVWGPVLIALVYLPAAVLFVPGSILTIGAGLVCGLLRGTIAVSVGSTAGASLAFLLGRTLARGWVESKVSRNPKFQAIDQAVALQGPKIVLLTRLSPVFPYNLLNYAYGVTRVRFRDFLLCSWLGMLPGTVMYVYIGSTVKSIAELASGKLQGGVAQKILFGLGLVATVLVTVFVTRLARKAMREVVPEEPAVKRPEVAEKH
jgi:uncharacterized membrane protein YdjX (TVP38/TMEM64 family)